MKIALVITGLGMGGAEHVVVNLADKLASRGHTVKIAFLTGKAEVLPNNCEIEIFSINMKGSKDFLKAYIKLRHFINNFKPDVVHSHMVHANLFARLLRLTVKIPKLVCTAHNANEGGKLRMLGYRLTDKLATISTNVSDEAVESFIKKGAVKPGRMVSVVNGINTDHFVFDAKLSYKKRQELEITSKQAILSVGRLDTQKDYPNLLNAIAILKDQRQDFKVFIVGDGPLKQEICELTKILEIESCVEFLGIRRDIPALMSASDIFVLASAWEGFGLVVAEAMACERVTIATDCGGVAEVMGNNGYLIESRNSDILAQTLNKALALSEGDRIKIGKAARQRIIEKFSLDANVDAYLKLYSTYN